MNDNIKHAQNVAGYYTVAAGAKGAVPVPGMSAAIMANNAFMVGHINSIMRSDIDLQDVVKFVGPAAGVNYFGRTAFVEIARSFGWLSGPLAPAALAGVSALGASTAALQTYILSQIAIELSKIGCRLSTDKINQIVSDAKESIDEFMEKHKNTKNPDDEDPVVARS